MDEKKDICGETKPTTNTAGNVSWICNREPHADLIRQKKFNRRDGIFYFDEPPAVSHRFVNASKL